MEDKTLKIILDRLNIIENKLDQLNNDPYNLNNYFKIKNNQMPDGYTLVNSIGTD